MAFILTAGDGGFSASQVGSTVVTGLLIVFSVLGVIFLCMLLMERVFRKDKTKKGTKTVVSPLAGTVESVRNLASAAADEPVLVIESESGAYNEVLCPESGKLTLLVKPGDRVRSGDRLFTIEREA